MIQAGSDILADDLIHIKRLLATANQDLTAGTPVGISLLGSGVARALSNPSSSYDAAIGQTMTGNSTVSIPISGDKFVFIYEITNTTLRAVIVTINRATMSLSFGTAVTLTTDSLKIEDAAVGACVIDTDKFVVSYISNADTTITKAVVCTVSGTTITVGTPQTIKDYASGGMLYTAVCKLDTNKFAYRNSNGSSNNEVFACTVSGTVITVGTAVATGANITDLAEICQLDTNKFAILSETKYVQIFTVSGTTVTAGTQQNSSITGSMLWGQFEIVSHTTNAFTIRSSTNIKVATVSGTVATIGAEVSHSGTYGLLRVINSTNIHMMTNNSNHYYNIAISGTTPTLSSKVGGNKIGFATGKHVDRYGLFTTGNSYFILVYQGSTTTLRFFIEGMSIQFIGFVKSTVSRGDTADIILQGIAGNQSSLVPGETYKLGYNGVFSPQEESEGSALPSNVVLLKAISDTEVLF